MKLFLAGVLGLLTALALLAADHLCPIDDTQMTTYGQFKIENNHTFHLYRCQRGHQYWIRDN